MCVLTASSLSSVCLCRCLLLGFLSRAPSSWLSAPTSPFILLPPEERVLTAYNLEPGRGWGRGWGRKG